MHVEFTGPPGAGKSSIASQLCERLAADGPRKFYDSQTALLQVAKDEIDSIYKPMLRLAPGKLGKTALEKLWHRSHLYRNKLIEFHAKNPGLLKAVLSNPELINSEPESRSRMLGFFYDTAATFQCCNAIRDGQHVIYDEGFLQKSSMYIGIQNPSSPAPLQDYLEQLPTPALVVHVETGIQTCIERMEQRPRGLTQRLRQVSAQERQQYFENAVAHFNAVTNWLEINRECVVLKIDSKTPIEENVETILTQCRNLAA